MPFSFPFNFMEAIVKSSGPYTVSGAVCVISSVPGCSLNPRVGTEEKFPPEAMSQRQIDDWSYREEVWLVSH